MSHLLNHMLMNDMLWAYYVRDILAHYWQPLLVVTVYLWSGCLFRYWQRHPIPKLRSRA